MRCGCPLTSRRGEHTGARRAARNTIPERKVPGGVRRVGAPRMASAESCSCLPNSGRHPDDRILHLGLPVAPPTPSA